MARCSKCNTSVGCSCNLVEGLCATCYANTKNIKKNANTSVNNEPIKPIRTGRSKNTESGSKNPQGPYPIIRTESKSGRRKPLTRS